MIQISATLDRDRLRLGRDDPKCLRNVFALHSDRIHPMARELAT